MVADALIPSAAYVFNDTGGQHLLTM